MNWFSGSIPDAISLSKTKNAIFVVYVEGHDELSIKLRGFLNDERVRKCLESDNFVSIRIESGSENYMLFAQIYKLVPLPSLFFIDKNGVPIEIVTGIIGSCDDLFRKIMKVLETKNLNTAVASSSVAPAQQANNETASGDDSDRNVKPSTSEHNVNDHTKKMENAQKMIETKRKEKEEKEMWKNVDREVERRQAGQSIQNFKEQQKENELEKLREERKRDRLADQAARQRVLEQIASDRAERAQKNLFPNVNTEIITTTETITPKASLNLEITRIQFRTPDGLTHVQTFDSNTTFSKVREYVANTVLHKSINEFELAATFPKKIYTTDNDALTLLELNLAPSTLILIFCISKHHVSSSGVVQKSSQIITLFHSLFMFALIPVFSIFGYIKGFFGGTNPKPEETKINKQPRKNEEYSGAFKRLGEDNETPNETAKKRNLNRLTNKSVNEGASTSQDLDSDSINKTYRQSNIHRLQDIRDSDDENATWNGNSTQQQ